MRKINFFFFFLSFLIVSSAFADSNTAPFEDGSSTCFIYVSYLSDTYESPAFTYSKLNLAVSPVVPYDPRAVGAQTAISYYQAIFEWDGETWFPSTISALPAYGVDMAYDVYLSMSAPVLAGWPTFYGSTDIDDPSLHDNISSWLNNGFSAGCLASDCLSEYQALITACDGSGNIDFFDDDSEICEGYCKKCEDLVQGVFDFCALTDQLVSYYTCDEVLGNTINFGEQVVSLQESDVICTPGSCSDLSFACTERCSGSGVLEFACVDDVVLQPCKCVGESPFYDPGDFDSSDSSLDPETHTPGLSDTDSELLNSIANNSENNSDNTYRTANNTAAIADNTARIGIILDERLADIDSSITNIEAEVENNGKGLSESQFDAVNDTLTDHIGDTLSGATLNYEITVQNATSGDPVSESDISPILTFVEDLFPSYSSECIPVDLSFTVNGEYKELIVACEYADVLKSLIGAFLYIVTVFIIVDTVLVELRPGSNSSKKG